jgi:hypothetical protein
MYPVNPEYLSIDDCRPKKPDLSAITIKSDNKRKAIFLNLKSAPTNNLPFIKRFKLLS